MTNNCNVARDLMPLVIDGVASEESQQYVDEHIAECTECALTYGAMRVELPRANQEKERAEMERAASVARRKRILRGIAGVLVGILVFFMLTWAWNEVGNHLVTETKAVPLDQYTAKVVRTQTGECFVLLKMNENGPKAFSPAQYITWGYVKGNDKTTLNIELQTAAFPRKLTAQDIQRGKFAQIVSAGDVLADGVYFVGHRYKENTPPWDEIAVICGDERRVVYSKGDEIPVCSEELEVYSRNYQLMPVNEASVEAWRENLIKLLDTAPELQ